MNSDGKTVSAKDKQLITSMVDNRELLQVMTKLQEVKTITPKVQKKANETSMSDNNGKRITFTLTEEMLQGRVTTRK